MLFSFVTQRSGVSSCCRLINLSSIKVGPRTGAIHVNDYLSGRCHLSSTPHNFERENAESITSKKNNAKSIANFFDAEPSWSLKSLRATDTEYKPLTDQQIDHLAWLAHVDVEGEEREALKKDIASIVQFAKTFQHPDRQPQAGSSSNPNLDSGLLMTNTVGETETRMRKDNDVGQDLASDVLMPSAAESVYGMYVVPGTLATDEH